MTKREFKIPDIFSSSNNGWYHWSAPGSQLIQFEPNFPNKWTERVLSSLFLLKLDKWSGCRRVDLFNSKCHGICLAFSKGYTWGHDDTGVVLDPGTNQNQWEVTDEAESLRFPAWPPPGRGWPDGSPEVEAVQTLSSVRPEVRPGGPQCAQPPALGGPTQLVDDPRASAGGQPAAEDWERNVSEGKETNGSKRNVQ